MKISPRAETTRRPRNVAVKHQTLFRTAIFGLAFSLTCLASTAAADSPPVAVNTTYPQTVVGNISVQSANVGTPYTVVNHSSLGVPTATITAFDSTTAKGGIIVMTTAGPNIGQFAYDPPAGFTGPTDTFTFTLGNSAGSSTATVTIFISQIVWFIDNQQASPCTTVAAGCGRLGGHRERHDLLLLRIADNDAAITNNQHFRGRGLRFSAGKTQGREC